MNQNSCFGNEMGAADFRQRVRGTALWAAIGGGLMLYFGMYGFTSLLNSPLYAAALDARTWTLRIGGGAMLTIAGLCLTGWSGALLIDAVVCAGIVLMLALTGLVFLMNGDWEGILSLIFAAVFGAAGNQSWQLFAARPRRPDDSPAALPDADERMAKPVPDIDVGRHTVLEAIRRRRQSDAVQVPTATAESTVGPAVDPTPGIRAAPSRCDPATPPPTPAKPDEPEGGFLAALGRQDDKPPPRH